MRQIVNINRKWSFSKEASGLPDKIDPKWNFVNLPHTWNAIDGQDGGNDYYRGVCYYARELNRAQLPKADRYYLEVRGANSSADVYLNGKRLAHHDGGYSAWRTDMTDAMEDSNLLVIAVDNSPNDRVYPQRADFTFYGGLYRDVNIIAVSKSHFDLDFWGSDGIKVTPEMDGNDARVGVEVFVTDPAEGQEIAYTVTGAGGETVYSASGGRSVEFTIKNVRKWHGRRDPYLYTVRAELRENGKTLDDVSARFGCRSYRIDPGRGFILNGEEYPLRGVARHQDRWGIGNALLPEHHREDMDLICEMGCTTVRLAHYQHDRYFYDLCDERGLVVWAEIPYISSHLPAGRENTLSQMKELIAQNYNHPSIVVWGLSNEITMGGETDPDMIENHKQLNSLCHSWDRTRLTTEAVLSVCPPDCEYVHIPDVVSYNHYFGWYGGDTSMNAPWFDNFHAKCPDTPVGISEYGCEALNWHTSEPEQGDYTEEYQAYYHEELIRQLYPRKYIWATHVWNMFDFGADARAEGGENGQNHKGLVTFDRKYKKDAFYAYKAWLSDEPFVHLCGKRYVDRVEDVTKVTVYSNQKTVELFADGVSVGKKEAADHFFYFQVPNRGQTRLEAVSGSLRDEGLIRKVDKFNEDYRLKETGALLSWYEISRPEGYLSINDKISDITATVKGKLLIMGIAAKLLSQMKKSGKEPGGGKLDPGLMKALGSFTLMRLLSMSGVAGLGITKEELLDINERLNKIKKQGK